MRILTNTAVFSAALALTTTFASAAVYSGVNAAGTINQDVSTSNAYVGERVVLNNVRDENGNFSGGTLYGTVTQVQKAGQGRPGRLQMNFTRLTLPSGASYDVSTSLVGMQANTKNNTVKEAGGALAGMLVGNAISKTIFHVGGGGLIGAAGGFLLAKNNRQDMTVPAGSVVTVHLNSVVRRQSHG